MTKDNLLEELKPIFADVILEHGQSIDFSTSASDVENWDSINHLVLIVAIEKKYKIRFSSSEIQAFRTIGEMCDSILEKVSR